jgi:undecaprenyl-diphosphatase
MPPPFRFIELAWRFLQRFEAGVLVSLVLATGALWTFLEVGGEVAEGDADRLDRHILLLFREPGQPHEPIGSRRWEEVVRDITALGGTTVIALVTIVAVLAFLIHRKRRHSLVMAGAVLLAWASSSATKALYGRPRPDLVPHGVEVYSASFPSGHSTLSAATYLTLAMLIASLEASRGSKALAYGLAVLLLVTVGFSRVYLGVHWPSDVVAGWSLGAAWALAAWLTLRFLGARARN